METMRENHRIRPLKTARYVLLIVLLCAVVGGGCYLLGGSGSTGSMLSLLHAVYPERHDTGIDKQREPCYSADVVSDN